MTITPQIGMAVIGGAGGISLLAAKARTELHAPRGQRAALRSLAKPHDVAALTPKQVERSARRLRTQTLNSRHVAPADTGIALGTLAPRGPMMRASWEDVAVAIMAPRAGKTTTLAIPTILHAPGPAIATSNKRDLWDATHAQRGGRTWTFDPQNICGDDVKQDWWWNPVAVVNTVEAAERFASHFVQTVDNPKQRDIWGPAAQELLSALALAAHYGHRTVNDIYMWLTQQNTASAALDLLNHNKYQAVANGLRGILTAPDRTRDSIFITARVAAKCLRDPHITAWVTPHHGQQFNPQTFVHTSDTLHMLSKDGGGSAAPLVAALTDAVMQTAVHEAERAAGGRLDPPLVVVLDEAANVCRIADLPKLYTHFGSRGIFPLTILQSYAQGASAWHDFHVLWSSATVKLVGPGIDEPEFRENLTKAIGEHEVWTTSYGRGRGGGSRTRSVQHRPILTAAEIRALRKGTALLFATGCKPALIELHPYWEESRGR